MSYVFIHGRGLAGLSGGDPRDGAPTRGVPVGAGSMGIRGMQHPDAGLPRSILAGLNGPLRITVEHDGAGGLRGLREAHHALGDVSPDFENGLNALVASAQDASSDAIENVGFLSRGAAQRWAESVVDYTKSVRSTLTAKRDGVAFYVREPEAAARLLANASKELKSMVAELQRETGALVPGSMTESFDMIITGCVNGLVRGASVAVKAAIEEAGKLPTLPSGIPGWVAPAAGLVALLIVARVVL